MAITGLERHQVTEREPIPRHNYLENGKLTQEGRQLVKEKWENNFGGKKFSQVETELDSFIATLGQSALDKKIKTSFKLRARALERKELLGEAKNPESIWHEYYQKIKNENPQAKDATIAAAILKSDDYKNRDKKAEINTEARETFTKTEEQNQESDRYKNSERNRWQIYKEKVARWAGVGLFALGVWLLGSAAVEAKTRNETSQEASITNFSSSEVSTKPKVIYQATDNQIPVSRATETRQSEPTLVPTEIPKKVHEPFEIAGIDLKEPVSIEIPELGINYANQPMVNQNREGWPETLLHQFDSLSQPNGTVIVRGDVEGMNIMMGHSFSLKGQPLPFDWMRTVDPQELVGKTIYISQNGIRAELEISYVNTIGVKQFLNSDAVSGDEKPMYIRTDITEDARGNKYGLGIPDSERQPDRLILVTCDGYKNGVAGEKYTDRKIIVARVKQSELPEQKVEYQSHDTLIEEVTYLKDQINNYIDTHNPSSPEKLGSYLKNTNWYKNKTEAQQEDLASVLSVLDNKTYAINGPNGPQAMQCIDAVSLWSALGYIESPKNPGALPINNAKDIVSQPDHFGIKIKGNVRDVGIQNLSPGDMVLVGQHFVTVIGEKTDGSTRTVYFADANRNQDGRVEVFSASHELDLIQLFPPGSLAVRQPY